jgi:hypothetical protein
VAYLHQDSVSQEADPTRCECHSDEKQRQRSARFSDKISASCDHEAYPCYPIASRQCDFRHIRDSAPFLDRHVSSKVLLVASSALAVTSGKALPA